MNLDNTKFKSKQQGFSSFLNKGKTTQKKISNQILEIAM